MKIKTLITLLVALTIGVIAQDFQNDKEEKEKFRRSEFKRSMKKLIVSN